MLNQPFTGFIRVPYEPPCRLVGPKGAQEGRLCNISVKGVYVTLAPIPNVGEAFRISFNLPDDEKPVEAAVEVAWRNTERDRKVLRLPLGCGLHFIDLSPADQERVAAFVEAHRQG
jgi:PilZ domain-containing protein